MKKSTIQFFTAILLGCICTVAFGDNKYFTDQSIIGKQVVVYNAEEEPKGLLDLIQQNAKPLNVVFIFGGGGLGHQRAKDTGGLWCPDSFEDLHILRSLKATYGENIGLFPIAIPPAHHTRYLGMSEGVFLKPNTQLPEYRRAVSAFVESTQGAVNAGIIPVKAYYDIRYNLLASDDDLSKRQFREAWHGAFRAANESQTYGVPSLWLVDKSGRVLTEPFRGNVYHPHGTDIAISYTLSDIVNALTKAANEQKIVLEKHIR